MVAGRWLAAATLALVPSAPPPRGGTSRASSGSPAAVPRERRSRAPGSTSAPTPPWWRSPAPTAASRWPRIPPASVELAASIPYSRSAATNYLIGGSSGEQRRQAASTSGSASCPPRTIRTTSRPTADICGSCHLSVYPLWSGSNHAGAARNEWVLDLFSGSGTPGGGAGYVFRDSHDARRDGLLRDLPRADGGRLPTPAIRCSTRSATARGARGSTACPATRWTRSTKTTSTRSIFSASPPTAFPADSSAATSPLRLGAARRRHLQQA